MRAIRKEAEPVELMQYRVRPGASYDGGDFTPVKDRIREALLAEQEHLCAYCMQRISISSIKKMKLEHWHGQSQHPTEQLDYANMLGCCLGNEGSPLNAQHCDTKKADSDISLNPSNQAHHARMRMHYIGDGKLRSDDEQFDGEINSVLNLNWSRLRSNRKAVWMSITQVLSKNSGSRTQSEVKALIDRWNKRDTKGRLKEYCAVAVYYLEKKLAKMI